MPPLRGRSSDAKWVRRDLTSGVAGGNAQPPSGSADEFDLDSQVGGRPCPVGGQYERAEGGGQRQAGAVAQGQAEPPRPRMQRAGGERQLAIERMDVEV
jgi:hypothetical protein